jgi:B-box zinc finger.
VCKHLFSCPVVTPCCSTSVCLDCLKRFSHHEGKHNDRLVFNCLFCKKEKEDFGLITPNNFLTIYIDQSLKRGNEDELLCERCDKKFKISQIYICSDCGSRNFCQDCTELIHGAGRYREHKYSSIVKGVIHQADALAEGSICHIHVREKIESICLKDQTVLCNLCAITHKQSCKGGTIVPLK